MTNPTPSPSASPSTHAQPRSGDPLPESNSYSDAVRVSTEASLPSVDTPHADSNQKDWPLAGLGALAAQGYRRIRGGLVASTPARPTQTPSTEEIQAAVLSLPLDPGHTAAMQLQNGLYNGAHASLHADLHADSVPMQDTSLTQKSTLADTKEPKPDHPATTTPPSLSTPTQEPQGVLSVLGHAFDGVLSACLYLFLAAALVFTGASFLDRIEGSQKLWGMGAFINDGLSHVGLAEPALGMEMQKEFDALVSFTAQELFLSPATGTMAPGGSNQSANGLAHIEQDPKDPSFGGVRAGILNAITVSVANDLERRGIQARYNSVAHHMSIGLAFHQKARTAQTALTALIPLIGPPGTPLSTASALALIERARTTGIVSSQKAGELLALSASNPTAVGSYFTGQIDSWRGDLYAWRWTVLHELAHAVANISGRSALVWDPSMAPEITGVLARYPMGSASFNPQWASSYILTLPHPKELSGPSVSTLALNTGTRAPGALPSAAAAPPTGDLLAALRRLEISPAQYVRLTEALATGAQGAALPGMLTATGGLVDAAGARDVSARLVVRAASWCDRVACPALSQAATQIMGRPMWLWPNELLDSLVNPGAQYARQSMRLPVWSTGYFVADRAPPVAQNSLVPPSSLPDYPQDANGAQKSIEQLAIEAQKSAQQRSNWSKNLRAFSLKEFGSERILIAPGVYLDDELSVLAKTLGVPPEAAWSLWMLWASNMQSTLREGPLWSQVQTGDLTGLLYEGAYEESFADALAYALSLRLDAKDPFAIKAGAWAQLGLPRSVDLAHDTSWALRLAQAHEGHLNGQRGGSLMGAIDRIASGAAVLTVAQWGAGREAFCLSGTAGSLLHTLGFASESYTNIWLMQPNAASASSPALLLGLHTLSGFTGSRRFELWEQWTPYVQTRGLLELGEQTTVGLEQMNLLALWGQVQGGGALTGALTSSGAVPFGALLAQYEHERGRIGVVPRTVLSTFDLLEPQRAKYCAR